MHLCRRTFATGLAGVIGFRAQGGMADPLVTWRCETEYPATAMPGEGVASFVAAVSRLSHGGMVVQPRFDGMRSAAMIGAVSEGTVEAADAFTGAMAAVDPIFQLSSLPFLTGSTADTARLLGAARPAYAAVLAAQGMTLLYATPWPATGIWSRSALSDADALKGLKIRTYDAASTAVLRGAGAAPSQISFADAMPRLRSGELDAVLSSGDGGAGARLWELLPHFTAIEYASPLSLAFCRTASLDGLADPLREAVTLAGLDAEMQQFTAISTRAAENNLRMRDHGVSVGVAPAVRAALVKAASPIVADWEAHAGAYGKAALSAFRG